MLACSMIHEKGDSNPAKARLSVRRHLVDNQVEITICMHCKKPKCLSDCASDAIGRNQTGVVVIDEKKCTACGNCEVNCPFGAIVLIKARDIYQKCDLCEGRESGPICVEVCPVQALVLRFRKKGS
jgi:carbon-monoxide dehydrogenase iron sulfur subunit